MRILCLPRSPLDYFGGISIYCLNLYKNFDLKVKCFSYDISNSIKSPLKRNLLGIDEEVFPSELNYGTLSISLGYFIKIIRTISEFDIVHIQHPDPLSAISLIVAKFIKPSTKIITTWHAEVYKSYLLFAPFLIILDFIFFLISDKLVYFTPTIESSLLSKIPIFAKKIELIPNTIDTKNIIKFKTRNLEQINIQKKENINIVSVGRLVTYKGYEYAIRALSMLDDRFKYKIIGKGPLAKKLKKLIHKNKLEERVILLGEISNNQKYEILNQSDIFLFPSISTSEAYGLSQIEAMCFDLPIINTQLNNGVNFLVSEEDGITCLPKSSKQLKNAILKLSFTNNTYQKMCKKSRENLKRFSLKEMCSKYKELILSFDD